MKAKLQGISNIIIYIINTFFQIFTFLLEMILKVGSNIKRRNKK